MIFDYPTLKLIWWLLVGVLLVGFAIMDGHDMGVGTLLRSTTANRNHCCPQGLVGYVGTLFEEAAAPSSSVETTHHPR